MTAPGDELADLRRRAYGPGAALGDDDLARLQSLEDAWRAPDDTADAPDAEETHTTEESDAEEAPDTVPAPDPPPPVVPLRRVLRRRSVILALTAIAVVTALVAATWMLTRPGGTVLRRLDVNDTAAQESLSSSLTNYGLDRDSYVQFEPFEGFDVWTARIPDRGVRCLLVVDAAKAVDAWNGLVGYSCTPEGLEPSVDLVQFDDGAGAVLEGRPTGTVARFVFDRDHVEVSVVEPRSGGAAASR